MGGGVPAHRGEALVGDRVVGIGSAPARIGPTRGDIHIIDFPEIFAAAGRGIRYYVVEHDPRFGDPTFDPFKAAAEGFAYLDCVTFKR